MIGVLFFNKLGAHPTGYTRSKARIEGVVECGEVCVMAGHKGRPDQIKGRAPRRRRL